MMARGNAESPGAQRRKPAARRAENRRPFAVETRLRGIEAVALRFKKALECRDWRGGFSLLRG
jgi:hypothetical protein